MKRNIAIYVRKRKFSVHQYLLKDIGFAQNAAIEAVLEE
jgi:hypothetical protein